MAFREVRVPEWGNRLVFRYDPVTDRIEVVERRQRVVISLDDHRPQHMRRQMVDVRLNFERIEGDDNV